MRNMKQLGVPLLPFAPFALLVGLAVACGGSGRFSSVAEDGSSAGAGGDATREVSSARPAQVDVPWLTAGASQGGSGSGGAAPEPASAGAGPIGDGGDGGDRSEMASDQPARQVTQTLVPVASLTGVVARPDEPQLAYGFLTFDLRDLPANILELDHASARAGDYVVQAPVPVFDVTFQTLEDAASALPNRFITTLPVGLHGDLLIPQALWPVLASDYQQRATQPYAQFRFDLPPGTDRASAQRLLRQTSLELAYLVR